MGDLSAEPSMEDILASIKRVIKEGETQVAPRRLSPRPASVAPAPRDQDEVLELRQPLAPNAPAAAPADADETPSTEQSADRAAPALAMPFPAAGPPPASPPVETAASATAVPGISTATAQATRGALDALSRLVIRPEPGSDGTLEGLVRDMLRPMLSDWLDANLPGLVEEMVSREIARITNRP